MMDDINFHFDALKISAFSKYKRITEMGGNIHNVTIGPNSSLFLSPARRKERKQDKTVDTPDARLDLKEKASSALCESVPIGNAIRQLQKDLEAQRQDKLEAAVNEHVVKFENFSKQNRVAHWVAQQQVFIQGVHQQEQNIIQAMQSYDITKQNRNKQLAKHYQEVAQKKIDMEKQLEKSKEKQRQLNEIIEKIKKCQVNFRIIYQEIVTTIKSCKANDELKEVIGPDLKILKSLSESIEEVYTKCKNISVCESDLKQGIDTVNQLRTLQTRISALVNNINDKKLAEEQRQVEELKKQQVPKIESSKSVEVSKLDKFEKYVSAINLQRYTETLSFQDNHLKSFQDLLNDDHLKQFKFDCKKAVNIPINAISSVNSEHLKDKYVKLSSLLSGKNVLIADHQINASKHPQGIAFCMDLLAKKFILQGDLMISSNPEAAFAYATIILSLWNDFPDFGKLILAYFYSRCPYLVPFYIPKMNEDINEEYYTLLGYQYTNGQIEKQDKFLKRISGIFRLYFAILISKPKKSQGKSPHNIKHAWTFVASLLKLEPQLDVTATALHIFLETAGFEMENVYGKCFNRILSIIEEKFLPALKKLDSGGPVTRLEVLLQNYRKDGHFKQPNGLLPNNFW